MAQANLVVRVAPGPLRLALLVSAAVVLALAAILADQGAALAGGPPNDNFDSARIIGELPYEDTIDTTGATVEGGEPDPCETDVGATVWYSFTPSSGARVVADTLDSDFDTVLAVYSGTGLNSLELIACNDDVMDDYQSLVAFQAQAGETYYIQAGGYDGETGELVLSVYEVDPPGNDDFAAALHIPSLPFVHQANTVGATLEDGEPIDCEGDPDIGSTLWFAFTPTEDSPAQVSTFGSGFDTLIAVYTGAALSSLDQVTCNDDAEFDKKSTYQSLVEFDMTAGVTYYIQVGGYYGDVGDLVVTFLAATTFLTEPADAEDTVIRVDSLDGFAPDDDIVIDPFGKNEEENTIAELSSIVLRATANRSLSGPIHQMTLVSPLEFAHETGETVTRVLLGTVPGFELTWGDVDCDGTVAIGDALKTARHLIGLSVSQTDPCPPVGEDVFADGDPRTWGDVDCDGTVVIGDALKIARHLIGLSVSQTDPCPNVGSQVPVVIPSVE